VEGWSNGKSVFSAIKNTERVENSFTRNSSTSTISNAKETTRLTWNIVFRDISVLTRLTDV